MVKRTYTILYKNGVKETMEQMATIEDHQEICRSIETAMRDGLKGYLRFGHAGISIWVNVADITRIRVEMHEELENNSDDEIINSNGGEVH